MARLIVKSPYIKCGGSQGADGYMRYIATRERVEIIPDDRPPTRKQEQLITKLTKDFPDVKELLEYEDYVQKPTKANASSMITLALEEHWKQVQQTDGYMKYIATRPRAERLGDHGLFGDVDHVDLDAAISELEHYTGNVWTHIISLHREDAERLGYNNAQAWRALLRARRNDIAAAMHILPQDFRWYPGNVLFVPTVTGGIHPTQKPVELCEYFIKTYTRPGELVADICAGSGTTAVAALNAGRRFVCFETAPAFYAAASERIRVARSAVEAGEKGV